MIIFLYILVTLHLHQFLYICFGWLVVSLYFLYFLSSSHWVYFLNLTSCLLLQWEFLSQAYPRSRFCMSYFFAQFHLVLWRKIISINFVNMTGAVWHLNVSCFMVIFGCKAFGWPPCHVDEKWHSCTNPRSSFHYSSPPVFSLLSLCCDCSEILDIFQARGMLLDPSWPSSVGTTVPTSVHMVDSNYLQILFKCHLVKTTFPLV